MKRRHCVDRAQLARFTQWGAADKEANMTLAVTWKRIAQSFIVGTVALIFAGCAPDSIEPDNSGLQGADDTASTSEDGISGDVAVGTKLVATEDVNLRSGPSADDSILHVVPAGGTVTVQDATPQNGFYKVKHDGTVGWSKGKYYDKAAGGGGTSGSGPRQAVIDRAKLSTGFSYWWGHGRISGNGATSSNKGSCSGSDGCPSCTHHGSWGADCSGMAAKAWQVPESNDTLSDDSHPYSTVDFSQTTSRWKVINRDNIQKGDAMSYNSGGHGHIFIYEKGDPWGTPYAYECKGCAYGCVKGYRSASSQYKAITKKSW
jgi:hypothetical protein